MSTLNIHEKFFNYNQLIVTTHSSYLEKVINWFEGLQQSFLPKQVRLKCQNMLAEAFENGLIYAHKKLPQETTIDFEVIMLSQLIILKIWNVGLEFKLKTQTQKMSQDEIMMQKMVVE